MQEHFLYGINPVEQALIAGKRSFIKIYFREGKLSKKLKCLVNIASKKQIPIQYVSNHTLSTLTKSRTNQGVALCCGELPVLSLRDFLDTKQNHISTLIALDQIEDPQNLGAIIRTASFLGATGLLITKQHSAPLSAIVSKTSAGMLETFPIILVSNLSNALEQLKKEHYWIVGSILKGTPISEYQVDSKVVLVMGNEERGIRQIIEKKCDVLVSIYGKNKIESIESLNVNAATGILLHHIIAQQNQLNV